VLLFPQPWFNPVVIKENGDPVELIGVGAIVVLVLPKAS
jgi:hypothetical protein